MSGRADPDCRRAYPVSLDAVDDAGRAHRAFVRAAVHARRAHVALRRGEVRVRATAGRALALERVADGQRAIVALNAGDEPADVPIAADGLDGLTHLEGVAVGSAEIRHDPSAIGLAARSAVVFVDG